MSDSSAENTGAPLHAVEAHAPSPRLGEPVIRVSSPVSLLAAVPLLLKFQPSEPSIVVLGIAPPNSEVAVTLRYDIASPERAGALARDCAGLLAAQRITRAYAVGYGPEDLVTPVADALRARFATVGITIPELLRVQDGRYWSYMCGDSGCCAPGGTAFDVSAHPLTRKYGHLVLPSREALAATVAPVTGKAAASMRKASRAVLQRAARLSAEAGNGKAGRRALRQAGLRAVAEALDLYRGGGEFRSHEDAAWLALVLRDLAVRDDAWARMLPEHREAHQRLWTDLATLAQGDDAAAPAALLAFTAWQDGDGALGNVALDRALAANPRYSMAQLLRQALDAGAPPSMARLPMAPEEVADAYDELEAEQPGDAEDADQAEDADDALAGDLADTTA